MVYVVMTDGMDGKQRGDLDEALEGFDKKTSRQRRVDFARSLGGGVVMAGAR